jgi:hypothetical protein
MNKFSIFFQILIAVLVAAGTIFQLSKKEVSVREAYDQYLAMEYSKIDNLAGTGQEKTSKFEHPELGSLQNYFMTLDPVEKRVPTERLIKAYQYTKSISNSTSHKSSNSLEWSETGSDMGGRVRGIMWDPNSSAGNKVWSCAVTGGLWFNDDISDDNSEWQVVDDFWPGLTTNCIAYDPNNTQIFYVGTGEYHTSRVTYRESSGVGFGIWKSTDGGENWELIPSTEGFKYISDIKVRDEEGTSVIYAGVVSGIYWEVQQSEPNDGLYRSADGGETWEQVMPNIIDEDVPYAPADIEITANGRIFIGSMKNLDNKGGATILYSDEGTAGTWNIMDNYNNIIPNDPEYPIPGRIVLSSCLSQPEVVYAIVGAGWYNSAGFNLARGKYILRSNDSGESWSETNLPGGDENWASLSWHAFVISVNPSDPDNIMVGGLDCWKSGNGGNSWTHVSDWAGMYNGGGDDYVHADQHWQVFKPGSSEILLLSTDGGVFYTENASANYPIFEEKNKNHSSLQYYSADISPVPGQNHFAGGLQDNGTLVYTGEPITINEMINGGDGAYTFYDENQPQYLITSTYYNSYRIHTNYGYGNSFGDYGTGVFVNPADYDSDNNILYANAVTFTNDYSNQLLRMSNVTNNPSNSFMNLGTALNTFFSHVKVSPHSPAGGTTLFVGSQNGSLYKVTNAQASADVVEIGSSSFPTAFISSVAVGGSEDTLLVSFTNYGVPSVWQSYDGGNNWADISSNLPDMPVRWALYHPQNALQIMLATEIGIWSTNDGSADAILWEPDTGMPNVRIDMLQMRTLDNTVVAATHGRGMMWTQWDYNPISLVKENTILSINCYPNPGNGLIHLNFENRLEGIVDILVTNVKGEIVFNERSNRIDHGTLKIDLRNQASGVYFVQVSNNGKVYTEKIIFQ